MQVSALTCRQAAKPSCRRCTAGTAPVGGELSSSGTRLGMRSAAGLGLGARDKVFLLEA